MFKRKAGSATSERLGYFPGVVLLGPRQVGKTTLAQSLAAERPDTVFLDLEKPADRAKLSQPDLFFRAHRDRLVVLDEVQHAPGIFEVLRPEIDEDRRPGRFLLLGSASGVLLRQSSESLAGRVSYVELPPLLASETGSDAVQVQSLWTRGGFPLSFAAPSDHLSYVWRQDFIRTFLQRDLPGLGVNVAAETMHRFWRMLAHLQGQAFNASRLGASLGGLAHTTVARHLDSLVDAMVVRRIEPWLVNTGKRLVKSPKVYIRDSGLVHALLSIPSAADLFGHPVTGASWEGFVIEQILAHAPLGSVHGYYRTSAGAEIDLVLAGKQGTLAFEIKFSTAPKPTRGFWSALQDLQPRRAFVVAPVSSRYPLADGVEVLPIADLPEVLADA